MECGNSAFESLLCAAVGMSSSPNKGRCGGPWCALLCRHMSKAIYRVHTTCRFLAIRHEGGQKYGPTQQQLRFDSGNLAPVHTVLMQQTKLLPTPLRHSFLCTNNACVYILRGHPRNNSFSATQSYLCLHPGCLSNNPPYIPWKNKHMHVQSSLRSVPMRALLWYEDFNEYYAVIFHLSRVKGTTNTQIPWAHVLGLCIINATPHRPPPPQVCLCSNRSLCKWGEAATQWTHPAARRLRTPSTHFRRYCRRLVGRLMAH